MEPASPRRPWVALGLWLLVGAVAGVALVRLITAAGGADAVGASLARIGPGHWAALVPLTVAFYSLDWLRYATLLSILGHRLSYRHGLELAAVSYFVTCLTPTAELHVPAMVLWLVRAGVPVGAATAATLAKSIYMLGWVCATGLVGLAAHDGPVLPPGLGAPLAGAFVVPAALLVGLAAAVTWPGPIRAACARRLARPGLRGWQRALVAGLDDTVAALAALGRSRAPAHLAAHAASLAFVGCYVALGWLAADGVGLVLDAGRAATAFTGSLLVAYIAPTPGGAGATEGATAYLLDPGLSAAATSAALLVRVLCMYAIAPVGLALVLVRARQAGLRALVGELRALPRHPPPAG